MSLSSTDLVLNRIDHDFTRFPGTCVAVPADEAASRYFESHKDNANLLKIIGPA
jgi:hypothetical protein